MTRSVTQNHQALAASEYSDFMLGTWVFITGARHAMASVCEGASVSRAEITYQGRTRANVPALEAAQSLL